MQDTTYQVRQETVTNSNNVANYYQQLATEMLERMGYEPKAQLLSIIIQTIHEIENLTT